MPESSLRPFYTNNRAPGDISVPPITFEVYRGKQIRSSLRAPTTIDFPGLFAAVLGGESVTIRPSGRCPWGRVTDPESGAILWNAGWTPAPAGGAR
jgi:hypothetical protein